MLERLANGDASAAERLLPIVYDELKRLARRHMRGERRDHTLQPTEVVHEAYMHLVKQENVAWEGRSHFLAVASLAMKNLLVDHARRRTRQERGGDYRMVSLHDGAGAHSVDVELLDLHDALAELQRRDERQARIVELRYIGGLTILEVASVHDVAKVTVEREWAIARAWLRHRLRI